MNETDEDQIVESHGRGSSVLYECEQVTLLGSGDRRVENAEERPRERDPFMMSSF